MKKRLNFVLSFLLILAIAVGVFAIPAASYENDVETSSVAMLLVNLDTDTTCYAVRENGKWYASSLAETVTFLVAYQNIHDLKGTKVQVKSEFIAGLPYSDGCLEKFVGKTLTMEDLMAIMMLTSGSDAAYLIAETVSPGNLNGFVAMMNAKVNELGCINTSFVSPGYSDSKLQLTTCTDMVKVYKALGIIELYNRIMESPTYTPEGFDEEIYTVTTQNSICNPNSAYYFRYATGGKFTYSKFSASNLMVTTTYRGKTYLFIGLRGMLTSEQNIFLDARRLTTWAYLNLTDRKVIDADKEVAEYKALAPWGSYEVSLFAGNSAYKTLPSDFDTAKLSYEISVPDSVALPIFVGQGIGTAKIYYDGQKLDDLSLISSTSEGVSLLRDVANLGKYAMKTIAPIDPDAEESKSNEVIFFEEEDPDALINEAEAQAASVNAAASPSAAISATEAEG